MTIGSQASMVIALALAGGLMTATAFAAEDHVIMSPDKVEWGPAPAILPAGAQAAVLYGDPTKEGQFALRLKMPAGYHVPPHTHPVQENVTVISGTFQLGMGETADQGKAEALPAGSFFSLPPGMAHFAYAGEETVVQINTMGPWGLTYLNPADDPRKTN